jgi:nucleoside-diphosphate-sugar epimerase
MAEIENVLLTGSSGFLGNYIYQELSMFNVSVLNRQTPGDYSVDLATNVPNFKLKFDLIIHNAGLAHTAFGDFQKINVQGTRNLLKGLSKSPPSYFVFISSVSVYGKISGELLSETCPVLAVDPYGMSKIQAEAEIMEWCAYHGVICTILRLPLVVGKNPPGNLGAMIKGIRQGYYMNIGSGYARKSMVLAEDVARFILPASRVGGTYNLSDGEHPSFNQLSKLIAKQVNQKWIINIPFFLAKILAFAGDIIGPIIPINTDKLAKITSTLTFDDTLARAKFGWSPKPILGNFRI